VTVRNKDINCDDCYGVSNTCGSIAVVLALVYKCESFYIFSVQFFDFRQNIKEMDCVDPLMAK
jgi:hypothetical protein